jgi:hypothetical protein
MDNIENNALIPLHNRVISTSVDSFQRGLSLYLDTLGLPVNGVLVDLREREKVIINLPSVIETLPQTSRTRSFYISKFVAACGAGLFDAALNFVWDETIANLRQKVIQFDLDYFYNSVITDADRRKKFRTDSDILNLEDWELIRGCHLTEILSDIGFKHLDYIRDMRNWASAAHPNQNQLTGLQLISWLETCIIEVIGKEPSDLAIKVKRLLQNIRTHTLTVNNTKLIAEQICLLPEDLATSLLRTVFGMFCDPDLSVSTKNNIRLIAPAVWGRSPDHIKREIGMNYVSYGANADLPRHKAAEDFLKMVNGLAFLPKDTLGLKIKEAVSSLFRAHNEFNNFYNEEPHAKILANLIPENGFIPEEIRHEYVKTVVMCYIGNGYGVSHLAYPYYVSLIEKFLDKEKYMILILMKDKDLISRLHIESCQNGFRKLLNLMHERTSNTVVLSAIDFLLRQNNMQLPVCGNASEYKRILGLS